MTAPAWIEYRPDSRTLLLSAGDDFLLRLASMFTDLERDGSEVRALTDIPDLEVRGDLRVLLDPRARTDGLHAESDEPLVLRVSFGEEGWLEAAEKIEAVARGPGACHCYIATIGENDVTFVVSKGEYGVGR